MSINGETEKSVAILFRQHEVNGKIEIVYGNLKSLRVDNGKGSVDDGAFSAQSNDYIRLELAVDNARLDVGPKPARVTIWTEDKPFTFFLRDVNSQYPVYIPEYDAIVTAAGDKRSYLEIEKTINAQGYASDFNRFNAEPEETYEAACGRNRVQYCPTVLGVGGDIRLFQFGWHQLEHENKGYFGVITPTYNTQQTKDIPLPAEDLEKAKKRVRGLKYRLEFHAGPGSNSRFEMRRWLEDGCLPIVHAIQHEDDVDYRLTAFATLEIQTLKADAVRGSNWLVAASLTAGFRPTDKEKELIEKLKEAETTKREEELICCVQIEAVNKGRIPRYAFMKAPCAEIYMGFPHSYDDEAGFSLLNSGDVFSANRINGKPMPSEMSILLKPGETACFEFLVPHSPISRERALVLRDADFNALHLACRDFWLGKLRNAAAISVPEKAIDERFRAGLPHIALATYGMNAEGPLLASLGTYSPVGTESSPIIQFYDSMGCHDAAERCLDFFIARQHDDGMIKTFGAYEGETGAWLWTMGEHFQITHDKKWLIRVAPAIKKACEFLRAWRERNKKEEYRELGYYGLLDGQVADPPERYHNYMLNGQAHLGLKRAAEILAGIDPDYSENLNKEVKNFREDIRRSLFHSMGRAPLVPIGDGSWSPYIGPCAENPGGLALFAEGDECQTHGTFTGRDYLLGCDYLILGEVVEPHELGTDFILKTYQQPFTKDNSAASQPYYSHHVFGHMVRDEVKLFLKAYYNQMTGLQDRETYTFWEHFFTAGLHKVSEEAFFLMQTRMMLYMEEGDTLKLLRMVPRRWLEDGKEIKLSGVKTHFGALELHVKSALQAEGAITALVVCDMKRAPKSVTLRLPHPDTRKALRVEGGEYNPETETVTIDGFTGKAAVTLRFTP